MSGEVELGFASAEFARAFHHTNILLAFTVLALGVVNLLRLIRASRTDRQRLTWIIASAIFGVFLLSFPLSIYLFETGRLRDYTVSFSFVLLLAASGGTLAVVSVLNVVQRLTEEMERGKKARAKLLDYREQLESLIRSRTLELTDEITRRRQSEAAVNAFSEEVHRELVNVAQLQKSATHPPPQVSYVNIGHISLAMGLANGDMTYYNSYDELINVVVGDATGHGAASAFMTIMMAMGMASVAPDSPPLITADYLNRLLLRQKVDLYVTSAFAQIRNSGLVSVVHAGHPYSFIVRTNGELEHPFSAVGFALGMFDVDTEFEEEYTKLEPGDRLFLYTDGYTEARNSEGEFFGTERLYQAARDLSEVSPQECVETITDMVYDHWGKSPVDDDLTMVCVEYTGQSKADGLNA